MPPAAPAGSADGVALLQEARRVLAQDPAAALALTQSHASRDPGSPFRDEREALAIEALQRLHRTEAAARLRVFEETYPRSPYRRRLDASRGP